MAVLALDFARSQILTVTNTDPNRPTFFDVERDGRDRRQVVDAGAVFECRVAPGPIVVTFGAALAYAFQEEGDDAVVG